MPPRPGNPLSRKVIICEDCGRKELRPCNAVFCSGCRLRRLRAANRRKNRVRRDNPQYNAALATYKAAWARRSRASQWPVPCAMCLSPVPMVRGRHRTDALCSRCQREHRSAGVRERNVRASRARQAA